MKTSDWNEPYNQQIISEINGFRRMFGEMMEAMAGAEDGMLRGMFSRFVTQLERYFELENQLMENSAFPAASRHRHEHQEMLKELYYFKTRIDNGLFSLGRTYITLRLPEWFEQHAQDQDQDLTDHLINADPQLRSAA